MIFMGSDEIAIPSLDYLISESGRVHLKGIYTQPDRARGRGKKVQPNAIKAWALDRSLPVVQPESFGDKELDTLKALQPDMILVMAYGHLLPQMVLDIPTLGIYNIHTSLLPELRGASPIETAVASGYIKSGVSLMQLVMRMDAGPICGQLVAPIEPMDTGASYRKKLADLSPALLKTYLPSMCDGSIQVQSQNEAEATYCRLLVKQDGQLDFSQPARLLACRINGLNPWPGSFVKLEGVILKVGAATYSDGDGVGFPGEILSADASGVKVATGAGILRLLTLQKPGGKMLVVADFLRGFQIEVGACFESQEMHTLVSKKPVSHKRVFHLYQKP